MASVVLQARDREPLVAEMIVNAEGQILRGLLRPLACVPDLAGVLSVVRDILRDRVAMVAIGLIVWTDEGPCYLDEVRTGLALDPELGEGLRAWLSAEPRTVVALDAAPLPSPWAERAPWAHPASGCVVRVVGTDRLLAALVCARDAVAAPPDAGEIAVLDVVAVLAAGAIHRLLLEDALARVHAVAQQMAGERDDCRRALHDARTRLLDRERMASLGELLAAVAHEITNPVGFIVANMPPLCDKVDRLRSQATGLGAAPARLLNELAQGLAIVARGAERTNAIVRDLRAASRAPGLSAAPIDLHETIELALRLLSHRWEGRIRIEREFTELPPLPLDPAQWNQVFMNLIANACDAIADTGAIRLRTRVEAGIICIEVSDDGNGVPPEHRELLFDPFFTTKPTDRGTGLGLAIAKRVIELSGGRITLASEVGEGTTFSIHLPFLAGTTFAS